ncbi:MAG: hypothetical protein K2Q34_00640 [Alphaproteobacteria bacterium]|nr:hypothetical protein [Alphaproteobacteria bacterium]
MAMKEYVQNILKNVEEKIVKNGRSVVFLEAGHFKLGKGADQFALNSLNDALFLGKLLIKKFKKDIRLVFGILIDDLGQGCSETGCSINIPEPSKNREILPSEINLLFEKDPFIKQERVLLFFEKTAKNRSIKYLKKAIQDERDYLTVENTEDQHRNLYFYNQSMEKVLLAKRKNEIFNAYCPSIVGQHYVDICSKLKERFLHTNNFMIIDWSEIMDKPKVTNGAQALKHVFRIDSLENMQLDIINVFFMDSEGQFYEIEKTLVEDVVH